MLMLMLNQLLRLVRPGMGPQELQALCACVAGASRTGHGLRLLRLGSPGGRNGAWGPPDVLQLLLVRFL